MSGGGQRPKGLAVAWLLRRGGGGGGGRGGEEEEVEGEGEKIYHCPLQHLLLQILRASEHTCAKTVSACVAVIFVLFSHFFFFWSSTFHSFTVAEQVRER